MSEQTTTTTTTTAADEAPKFQAITTQEDLDRIITERVRREKAKFADYADLKAKAARLDKLENEHKTEAEKTGERITALERELAESRTGALRARIQARHGIADEDADLFLTGTDEDTLTRQAERLAARKDGERSRGNVVRGEGTQPANVTPTGDAAMRDLAKRVFGRDG